MMQQVWWSSYPRSKTFCSATPGFSGNLSGRLDPGSISKQALKKVHIRTLNVEGYGQWTHAGMNDRPTSRREKTIRLIVVERLVEAIWEALRPFVWFLRQFQKKVLSCKFPISLKKCEQLRFNFRIAVYMIAFCTTKSFSPSMLDICKCSDWCLVWKRDYFVPSS